jgi:hypothetical protein
MVRRISKVYHSLLENRRFTMAQHHYYIDSKEHSSFTVWVIWHVANLSDNLPQTLPYARSTARKGNWFLDQGVRSCHHGQLVHSSVKKAAKEFYVLQVYFLHLYVSVAWLCVYYASTTRTICFNRMGFFAALKVGRRKEIEPPHGGSYHIWVGKKMQSIGV